MSYKMNKKILTALIIMSCAETHGALEWFAPNAAMLNQDFLSNFMIALGIDGSGWGRTNPAPKPTYLMPLATGIGNGSSTPLPGYNTVGVALGGGYWVHSITFNQHLALYQ